MPADNVPEFARLIDACRQFHLDRAAYMACEVARHVWAVLRNLPATNEGRQITRMRLGVSNEVRICLGEAVQAGVAVGNFERELEGLGLREISSLSDLAALVDPELEALLVLMRQAQDIAERIDRRRGRMLAD